MSKRFGGAKPNPPKFGKTNPIPQAADPNRLPPQFSFEYMKGGNGYSVDCCDGTHRSALASRLFLLSQISWLEIQNAPRHGLGSEKIARSSLNVAVPDKISEDASFLALRYNGKHPIVGFRDGRIFHIIFIDHNFTLYDHG